MKERDQILADLPNIRCGLLRTFPSRLRRRRRAGQTEKTRIFFFQRVTERGEQLATGPRQKQTSEARETSAFGISTGRSSPGGKAIAKYWADMRQISSRTSWQTAAKATCGSHCRNTST